MNVEVRGRERKTMTLNGYLVESSTTMDLDPRERADYWSEHVTSYQCVMDYRFDDVDDFHGHTSRQVTDAYQLVEYSSDEIGYVRTPGQVRRDPDEDYRLIIPVKGRLVLRQDGRQTTLTPGTGGVMATYAPFELQHQRGTSGFILTIPEHAMNGPLSLREPLTTGIDVTRGLGRVVSELVTKLFEERDHLTGHQFDAVCDRLSELLCMLVVGDDRPDAPGHLAEVEAIVRGYVRRHAADPELSPATLARELGWSLRQIQLALQRVGTTPRTLIREERLRVVRDRLCNPVYNHLTITELALATGFSSVSSLSTAFRQRYGTSPREMRNDFTSRPDIAPGPSPAPPQRRIH